MKKIILVLMMAGTLYNPVNAQVNFDSSSDFDLAKSIASQDVDLPSPQIEKVHSDSDAGSCEGSPLTMKLRGRTVTLPAKGLWTLESHLATKEDSFSRGSSFPRTVRENISAHLNKACARLTQLVPQADCGDVYDTKWAKEWTPAEGGKAGQGAVPKRPSKDEEMWIFNMMWAGKAMPKAGTKFLATYNGKSVVVVGGYERGPSSRHFLGGFQREVLWALGATEDSSKITLSTLKDQSVPPGPITCN
ncbi:MAG: hypothetical protein WCK75_05580 [Elusimicrobiota bacterium]